MHAATNSMNQPLLQKPLFIASFETLYSIKTATLYFSAITKLSQ